jgi:ABC-type phosphate/phosphonate transport system substrate-binding protein/rhodanese-related sulfurtransferase
MTMKQNLLSHCLALAALALATGHASAELTAMVALEPTSKKEGLMLSRTGLESHLSKAAGQAVTVSTSDDLADVMRATRSAGYDVFIAPPQVAASALSRGYELVGSTAPAEQYVLVGISQIASAEAMRGRRLYLPQQDSIYTYLARGMLNASGLSFKDLNRIEYALYPQAGLVAMSLKMYDATVVRQSDWAAWEKENPGVAKVLSTSAAVPGGLSVVMKSELPPDVRAKVANWFTASGPKAGLKPVSSHADLADYKAVAHLGTFTPKQLPGAQVVSALDVKQLVEGGAVLVDTRTEKEYKTKRVPRAVLASYVEKSIKDVAFQAAQDDFSAIEKLDKSSKVIFACNGAECWKSYKASRQALAAARRRAWRCGAVDDDGLRGRVSGAAAPWPRACPCSRPRP